MKLKDHRLMQYRNLPNWPPSYLTSDSRQEIIDEFGILRAITLDTGSASRCFLMVEMGGLGYVSWIKFDNAVFRDRFVATVGAYLNRRIKDIGNVEVAD